MRILIVEDQEKLATALAQGLEQANYAVDVSHTGDRGLVMAQSHVYDAIILDRMLPGDVQGIDVLTQLRAQGVTTPILMLTAKDHTLDRIQGLNEGADDYLVKPFAFQELLARLQALLRRPRQTINAKLTYDTLELDRHTHVVKRAGKPVTVTGREFALLEYLMRNPDRTISKDELIDHVWNFDADVLPNTVEVYMGYLRKKIDTPALGRPLIHTKRGFGYVFGSAHV